ncbi:MAG: carbon-nitrogen hydrolase, partial [Helicobacter sp.]|nr:carbon-nitrogen hydrolase [Helicobacter sp.]
CGWFRGYSADDTPGALEARVAILRAHAVANGRPIVACNRVGFEKDSSGVLDGIDFWGNSFVFGAQGEPLGRLGTQSGILRATISRARSESVRRAWPFLRDRRIDAYNGLMQRFL